MCVLSASLSDDQKDKLIEKLKGQITKAKGVVDKLDKLGTKKLAYPINYKTEGFYFVIHFTADASLIAEIERVLKITDDVIRFMTIKHDEKALRKAAKVKKIRQPKPKVESAPAKPEERPVKPEIKPEIKAEAKPEIKAEEPAKKPIKPKTENAKE
jgi:small subunit ribosomal protein S6